MTDNVVDVIALIISVIALILSLAQYFRESQRQKKEATLNAYNLLQEDAFSKIKEINLSSIRRGDRDWDKLTRALAHIENFCVGINTQIYSLDILNRLGGGFFIEQYYRLSPIIYEKRRLDNSPNKHYNEFEKTVKKLKKERGIR